MELTEYTHTTAKIIADGGNIPKADIMETANTYAEKLRDLQENIRTDYFVLQERLAQHGFPTTHEQVDALEKLGQMAIAVKKLKDAFSAVNTVRCL